MMIVSTTGYIVACIGPFLSDFSNNDASIMKNILLENIDNILNWIGEVDHEFSNETISFDLLLEWCHRGWQRISRRYRCDAKPWLRRRHAAISRSSTTIHHTRVESVQMRHQDSMGCGSSEPTHQGVQVLREHRPKLVADVLARWSLDRLCVDQLLSSTNRHFQTTRRRAGERDDIPHHEEEQDRKGKASTNVFDAKSIFFHSSCWTTTIYWSGPQHGKPLIKPISSMIFQYYRRKRSVTSLWVRNICCKPLYHCLLQVFFNSNVLNPTQRRQPEPPIWQQPSLTASKDVDYFPTLFESQPDRPTAVAKRTIQRFNSQQMKFLAGGVTVRLVAGSLGVAATFHQWSGFSLIDDGTSTIHAEHPRIHWTSSKTQSRSPISMIRPMTKKRTLIVTHWHEPTSFC